MQHVVVAQELDISNFENHVQTQALASLLKHLEGLELFWRKWWNNTLARKSLEGLDIVGIPLGIHSWVWSGLEVEDGCANIRLISYTLLTLSIKVPDWLGESLCNVWAFLLEDVPHVVR